MSSIKKLSNYKFSDSQIETLGTLGGGIYIYEIMGIVKKNYTRDDDILERVDEIYEDMVKKNITTKNIKNYITRNLKECNELKGKTFAAMYMT